MTMMDLINALLGFNAAIINRGRVAWIRVVIRSIIVLLILLLIGSITNYLGWKGLSLFSAFALGIAGIALALRPEGFVYATELGILSGIASQSETVRQDVRSFLELYARTAAKLLFWISGIFFILGTISIEENPWAVLGILAAVIVICSYVIGYNPKLVIARRVVYGYTCLMLVMLIFSLIPRHSFIRWVGIDVKGFFASTEAEIGVSRVEKAEQERIEEARKTFLGGIERKVRRNGLRSLSKEDLELYQKLEKERDERSLSKKVSSFFEQKKAEAKGAPPPTPLPPVPDRIAVLPAAPVPPPTPPVAVPKQIRAPEWELCEEVPDPYGPGPTKTREKCMPVRVHFTPSYNQVVIVLKETAETIYEGFQKDEEKGVFEGHWMMQGHGWDGNYGMFHMQFDTRDQKWEYARGWRKFSNHEKRQLTLKRLVMFNHDRE